MDKEKVHAAIDEVWRQRFSHNLPTELYNLVGNVKEQLHRAINEIDVEAPKMTERNPFADKAVGLNKND